MSSSPYEVVCITPWLSGLSAVPRGWIRLPGDKRLWKLKIDTMKNTAWVEKVVAEIADAVGMPCVETQLIRCDGCWGVVTRSFKPRAEELADLESITFWSGAKVVRAVTDGEPEIAVRGAPTKQHSIFLVGAILLELFSTRGLNPQPGWDDILETAVSYLVLDGLVANRDRNESNWTLVRTICAGDLRWDIVPAYDHGAAFASALSPKKKRALLTHPGLDHYIERRQGKVFWSRAGRYAPSPVLLAEKLIRVCSGYAGDTVDRIEDVLTDARVEQFIDRIPSAAADDLSKQVAIRILKRSRDRMLLARRRSRLLGSRKPVPLATDPALLDRALENLSMMLVADNRSHSTLPWAFIDGDVY